MLPLRIVSFVSLLLHVQQEAIPGSQLWGSMKKKGDADKSLPVSIQGLQGPRLAVLLLH